VDAFPRNAAQRAAVRNQPKFQVVVSGSRAKTILAIDNKKKPLDDVRVRRAIRAAIDRKAVIEGRDGYGAPIGTAVTCQALPVIWTPPGSIPSTSTRPRRCWLRLV